MSIWTNQMSPPPVEVAERFSPRLAKVVRDCISKPSDVTWHDVEESLTERAKGKELDPAAIDGKIGERQARIGALLSELDDEFRGLSEDLGLRKWLADPFTRYMRAVLSVSRRRPKNPLSASIMLADLHQVAASPTGHVNADLPPKPIRIEDFAQRPRVRVPPYETGAPGSESVDQSGRVRHVG